MKMIAITATIAAAIAAGVYARFITSEVGIMQLHPDLDEKTIVKAHRTMIARTLRGDIKLDTSDDDAIDRQFLDIYNEISPK